MVARVDEVCGSDTQKQPCQRVGNSPWLWVRGSVSGIRHPPAGVVVLGLPFLPARPLPRVKRDCDPPGQGLERDACAAQLCHASFSSSFCFWKMKCLGSQVGHLKHCTSFGKSKRVFKGKRLSSGVIAYFVVGNDR